MTRRINFWYLTPPRLETPYLYFDASRGAVSQANDPAAFTGPALADAENSAIHDGLRGVYAIKKPGTTANGPAFVFANDKKFQLLAAGVDDVWGEYPVAGAGDPVTLTPDVAFPDGPWTFEIADTLTNFTDGTLEDAQP